MANPALRRPALASLLAAVALACASPTPTRAPERLVDLTYTFDTSTIYWPTEEGFVLERGTAGMTDRGYYYEAHRFRAAEHGGTHIDAPIHFHAGGWTVDQIPPDRLMGEAVVVDVTQICALDRDHAVDVTDLAAFEADHGAIPHGSIVLLRTGFGRFWPDRKTYLGTDRRGPEAVAELHFPGLSPEAARWLVEQRGILAVGLDTASIDPGISTTFETHRTLFAANVPALENLANLDELPATGASFIGLPMKIGRGSGAPLRAVAIVPGSAGAP